MNLESIGYLFCYQGQDITFSSNPQDSAIPVCYYWQEPVYTESQVKELISKAGEVMLERCLEAGVMRNYKGVIVSRPSSEGMDKSIRNITAITFEDLK